MLPEKYLPEGEKEVILQKILWHDGTRKSFIALKRALWDKYHGDMRPYKIYPGEGWGSGGYYDYPIDLLFKMISEMVPGVHYDMMRIERFVCFYWS